MLKFGECNLQNMDLVWFKSPFPWIQFIAYGLDCHIIGARTVTDHPTKLWPTTLITCVNILHTFLSRQNLHIVFTRSISISFPVCHPTGELNSRRWFLSSHWVSLPGGESINEMLNEVKGHHWRVDHPSQMAETFDGIHYHLISNSKHWKYIGHTLIISNVISSSCITFPLTELAITDFFGMSLSWSVWLTWQWHTNETVNSWAFDKTKRLDITEFR